MWDEVLRLAIGNGLFAVLFCILFIYQLKDSKKREEKYTETISDLGERLRVVEKIENNTEIIIKQTLKESKVKKDNKMQDNLIGAQVIANA